MCADCVRVSKTKYSWRGTTKCVSPHLLFWQGLGAVVWSHRAPLRPGGQSHVTPVSPPSLQAPWAHTLQEWHPARTASPCRRNTKERKDCYRLKDFRKTHWCLFLLSVTFASTPWGCAPPAARKLRSWASPLIRTLWMQPLKAWRERSGPGRRPEATTWDGTPGNKTGNKAGSYG